MELSQPSVGLMSMHDDACPTPLLPLPLQKKLKEHLCWQVHCVSSNVE